MLEGCQNKVCDCIPNSHTTDLCELARFASCLGSVSVILISDFCISAGASQVEAALEKIRSHISNPKKFKKASPLLRQLLSQGAISKAHSNLLFEVPTSSL